MTSPPAADTAPSQNTYDIARYVEVTRRDPVGWLNHQFGVELWGKQGSVIEAVRDYPRVAVRSSNAAGKSFVAACAALWYSEAFSPSYVVITGASWTGIEKVVWPWIHRLLGQAVHHMGGDLLQLEYKRGTQWGIFSVSAVEPERFAGFRTSNGVMVIVDEASQLDSGIHEAIMGLTASANSRVLYIGNPLRTVGPFYEAFDNPAWHTIGISALETPNVACNKEIIPGLATRQWVEDSKREWGVGSAAYSARVMGEFPATGANSFFNGEMLAEVAARDVRPPVHTGDLRYAADIDNRVTVQAFDAFTGRTRLKLWCALPEGRPDQSHNYVMGIDISTGHGSSNSVITVADTTTREKVAEFSDAGTPPHLLAAYAVALAQWFAGQTHGAFMTWENNGPGVIFGDEVMRLGYAFFYFKGHEQSIRRASGTTPGWASSRTDKEWLLSLYNAALARHEFVNRCGESIEEARRYVYYPAGDIGLATLEDQTTGARDAHGDRVIADALACFALREQPRAKQQGVEPQQGSQEWRLRQRQAAERARHAG